MLIVSMKWHRMKKIVIFRYQKAITPECRRPYGKPCMYLGQYPSKNIYSWQVSLSFVNYKCRFREMASDRENAILAYQRAIISECRMLCGQVIHTNNVPLITNIQSKFHLLMSISFRYTVSSRYFEVDGTIFY